MPALLTSIVFDEKTKNYLSACLRERPEDDFSALMIEDYADMDDPFELNKLPDGDYTLLVGVNLERHTTATITLMHAETHGVTMQRHIDIAPVINSAIEHFEEYSAASESCDAEGDLPLMDAIDNKRMEPLKGILSPYIDSEDFHGELLTVLDLVSSYHVEERMKEMVLETIPEEERSEVVIPYRLGSNTLN